MSIYINRETVTAIKTLKSRYGNRLAQTNSRYSGKFCDAVRIYADPSHIGKPSLALRTITTVEELIAAAAEK